MLVELSQRTDDTTLPDEHDERTFFGKVVCRPGERGDITVTWALHWWELNPFAAAAAPAARRHVSTVRVSLARCHAFDNSRAIAEIWSCGHAASWSRGGRWGEDLRWGRRSRSVTVFKLGMGESEKGVWIYTSRGEVSLGMLCP